MSILSDELNDIIKATLKAPIEAALQLADAGIDWAEAVKMVWVAHVTATKETVVEETVEYGLTAGLSLSILNASGSFSSNTAQKSRYLITGEFANNSNPLSGVSIDIARKLSDDWNAPKLTTDTDTDTTTGTV